MTEAWQHGILVLDGEGWILEDGDGECFGATQTEALNRLGAAGWELTFVEPGRTFRNGPVSGFVHPRLYLKRPV